MRRVSPVVHRVRPRRRGATVVEVALVMPIFGMFLAGIMEFGHYYLVVHSLNSAARNGALLGSYEGATNAEVVAKVTTLLNASIKASEATILVRSAAVFDTANVDPATVDYNSLPAIDLTQADTGDCFLVQVQVPYDKVALLPPFWIKGRTITGRAVMRHE